MAKKKIIRAEDISAEDILSLYEDVLPLLYNNPKSIDPIERIIKSLKSFFDFDSYSYVMDDPTPYLPEEKFIAHFTRPLNPAFTKEFAAITVQQMPQKTIENSFDLRFVTQCEAMIQDGLKHFPDKQHYFSHAISSKEYPKISFAFFRFTKSADSGTFTKNDKLLLKKLAPHIFLLSRTSLSPLFRAAPFKSVDMNIDICSTIANQYKLSESESKLLPEILFGYSNDEIAQRNFISFLTVKKHIQHIFKKTGVKNRLEFISRFFTSPERVEL